MNSLSESGAHIFLDRLILAVSQGPYHEYQLLCGDKALCYFFTLGMGNPV